MPTTRARKPVPRDPVENGTVVEAEVVSIVEQESRWKNDDGTPRYEWSWKFSVVEGPLEGRWFWGQTPPYLSLNKASKLNQWVRAVMALDKIEEDFDLDTDRDLVGQRCRIDIGAREKAVKEDGSHLDDDGNRKISNWVEDVYRTQAQAVFAEDRPQNVAEFQEANAPAYDPAEEPF